MLLMVFVNKDAAQLHRTVALLFQKHGKVVSGGVLPTSDKDNLLHLISSLLSFGSVDYLRDSDCSLAAILGSPMCSVS